MENSQNSENKIGNVAGLEPAALFFLLFAFSSIAVAFFASPSLPSDASVMVRALGVIGFCGGVFGASRLTGLKGLLSSFVENYRFWLGFLPFFVAFSMLVANIGTA